MMHHQTVHMVRTDSGDAAFRKLVKLLDSELAQRDGSEHSFYHQYNGLEGLDRVAIAYYDGQALACGALKLYGADALEVKRMYTVVPYRGRGMGGSILNTLEEWARADGYKRIVLETGKRQPEAIALYEKFSYQRIPNYGPYAGVDNSVCFEKMLHP